MIDPKLTDITMEMVTLTLKMMEDGKLNHLLKEKLPHLLLHRTQSTPMNFHSRLSPEIELHTIDPKLMDIMMVMVTLIPNTINHGLEIRELDLHKERLPLLLHHKTQSTLTSFHSRPSPEIEFIMTDPKLTDTTMEMVMKTPNMINHGLEIRELDLPKERLLHLLHHRTQSTPTSFHSRLSPEIESLMTDPKLTDITTVMVMLTPNTMDHGLEIRELDLPKQPHLLHHRTQNILTSSHSRLSPEIEFLMTDLKLTDITMEMVTLTLKMMEDGKLNPLLKLLHLLPHKTQSTPTSSHSRLSPEIEFIMTDPKLMDTTTVMVTSTPKTMEDGKLNPLLKLLHLQPHKTQSTPTNFHSRPSPEIESITTDPKLTVTTTVMVMLTPKMMEDGNMQNELIAKIVNKII